MEHRRRWALLVLVAWVAVPLVSSAQFRGLGRITGTVTDESGAPLKDVSIRATLAGQEGVLEEKTDPKGWWAVNGLARGEWHLTFQEPGYAPVAARVNLEAELMHLNPITVTLRKAK